MEEILSSTEIKLDETYMDSICTEIEQQSKICNQISVPQVHFLLFLEFRRHCKQSMLSTNHWPEAALIAAVT
jgi:hypothetical protein